MYGGSALGEVSPSQGGVTKRASDTLNPSRQRGSMEQRQRRTARVSHSKQRKHRLIGRKGAQDMGVPGTRQCSTRSAHTEWAGEDTTTPTYIPRNLPSTHTMPSPFTLPSYLTVHEFQVYAFQGHLEETPFPRFHVLNWELSTKLWACEEIDR